MSRIPLVAVRRARRLLPYSIIMNVFPPAAYQFVPQIKCYSSIGSSHHDNIAPSDTETARMRAFELIKSSRDSFMDAEQVLLWWAHQRTSESVARSMQILQQMARHELSIEVQDAHLDRKMVNAIVINWQAVYKDGQTTLSPRGMLQKLDDIATDCPTFSLSGKAISMLIDVAVQSDEALLAEQLLRRLLYEQSFAPSTHTLNTVLQGYSNVNQPLKIQQLIQDFQNLELPLDINSYNIFLSCLANNQQPDLAEQYLQDLCRGVYHVTPNQWTFHAVLHALANSGQPERAEAILARLYDPYDWGALNVRPDTTTVNIVLACWARSGSPQAGQRALDWLQELQAWSAAGMMNVEPDVITYGTVIHALCVSGQVEQAETLVQNMYQQYMKQPGDASNSHTLVPNVKLLTPIMEGWSKSDAVDRLLRAEQFFEFLKDWARYFLEAPLDRAVYNVMMDVYGRCATTDDELGRAEKLLQNMKQSTDHQPNFATYSIFIQLLLRQRRVGRAEELMEEVRVRFKEGDVACRPDERSMNQLIRCFCRAEAPEAAAKLLTRMCERLCDPQVTNAIKPDIASFGSVVASFARSNSDAAAEHAESIYSWLKELHQRRILAEGPDYRLQRSRLACWSKSRSTNSHVRASSILSLMAKHHPETDVGDYNKVLTALVRQWKLKRADELLSSMITDGPVDPDVTSFNLVLLAWSRVNALSAVERVQELIELMKTLSCDKGWLVEPDSISYNNLLQCFARNTKIPDAAEKAEVVLQSMISANKASYISYVSVMNCWMANGNLHRAGKVLDLLYEECKKGRFTPDRKHFQSVADAYQAADDTNKADAIMEMWQSLKQVRRRYH
ncbi:hypothetical protein MPSEU_000647300 [Mayamaea pseudoterrestris]|nr:hypothetical protein MPSEU_000647300 [Mayamaea pseudoterrestris]